MPGVEDFGMGPVEARACGRPVVAYAEGGALESVIDGTTGVLVNHPSVDGFAAALRLVSSRSFDGAVIRRHAEFFSRRRFQEQFQQQVCELMAAGAGRSHRTLENSDPRNLAAPKDQSAAGIGRSHTTPGENPDPRNVTAGRDQFAARTGRLHTSLTENSDPRNVTAGKDQLPARTGQLHTRLGENPDPRNVADREDKE
jgi:hypothetical protein